VRGRLFWWWFTVEWEGQGTTDRDNEHTAIRDGAISIGL
jgi:hypothetical protein